MKFRLWMIPATGTILSSLAMFGILAIDPCANICGSDSGVSDIILLWHRFLQAAFQTLSFTTFIMFIGTIAVYIAEKQPEPEGEEKPSA